MALKRHFHELPVAVRRSPAKMHNYIMDGLSELGLDIFESEDPEIEEFTPVTYNFTSYEDSNGDTEWGTGTVQTTGVVSGNYTEIEVITNSTDQSFVGGKFFVISSAKTDGTIYNVYSDAGRTSAGFYVSITEASE